MRRDRNPGKCFDAHQARQYDSFVPDLAKMELFLKITTLARMLVAHIAKYSIFIVRREDLLILKVRTIEHISIPGLLADGRQGDFKVGAQVDRYLLVMLSTVTSTSVPVPQTRMGRVVDGLASPMCSAPAYKLVDEQLVAARTSIAAVPVQTQLRIC